MKATEQMIELAKNRNGAAVVAVQYEVGSYNERRYGRPWIAKIVSWNVGCHPKLEFGASSTEVAEIAARPGDIIKYGQKDNRNPRNTQNEFGIACADGTFDRITEAQARELYRLDVTPSAAAGC